MSHLSARQRKDRDPLTERSLLRTLRRALPRRNGYMKPNSNGLIEESRVFGIGTPSRLRRVLLKHRRALVADDRATLLDGAYMRIVAADYGEAHAAELRRKQCCFTWEALMRTAFELEFGERYDAYSRKRDGP
jgi:hypothetical protein